jgi:hypothetical protein
MSLDNKHPAIHSLIAGILTHFEQTTLERFQHMSEDTSKGLTLVRGLQIPPRYRPSKFTAQLSELQPGDGLVSPTERGLRSISVAARTYSKRLAAEGKEAPVFATRKITNGYALIRKS